MVSLMEKDLHISYIIKRKGVAYEMCAHSQPAKDGTQIIENSVAIIRALLISKRLCNLFLKL
jgi:hypothetical protein